MALHVGIIGSGQWSREHLAAIERIAHVGRVTLCGRNATQVSALAGQFAKVTATTDTVERLLEDRSIDLVDIVLPHHLHVSTTLAALAAGKHVICEKPAAMSPAELDSAVDAATRVGRWLLVVMNQLYNPRIVALKKLVADGLVGRPFLLVENGYANHAGAYRDPHTWRTRTAMAGGGVLIDGAYHMIYKQLALLAGAGNPRWVTGETAQLNLDPAGKGVSHLGEDFVAYTIGYDATLRVTASHAWTLESTIGRPREGFLAGTTGTLEMSEGIDGPILVRRGGELKTVPLPEPLTSPRAQSLHLCLDDYFAAICEDREPKHASLAEACATLRVIYAVYESSRRGTRIVL